jgi:hypothetical protein
MLLTEDREHRWWYAMDSASHSFVLSMLLSSLSAPSPSSSSSSSISLLNLPWFCFVSIYMSLMFSLVCKRRASNISDNGKGGSWYSKWFLSMYKDHICSLAIYNQNSQLPVIDRPYKRYCSFHFSLFFFSFFFFMYHISSWKRIN